MKNVMLFSDRGEIKKCIAFLKEEKIPILGLVSNSLQQADFDIPVLAKLDERDYSNTVLISYYYSTFIHQDVFKQFYTAINFHPAPMPYYRGVKCGVFAIINHEEKFGVTCHKINEKFDDGEIIGQIEFKIDTNETGFSLYTTAKEKLYYLFELYIKKEFLHKDILLFEKIDNLVYTAKKHSYYSNKNFEALKCFDGKDILSKDSYTILRALWTPSYIDAFITNTDGKKIYLTIKEG